MRIILFLLLAQAVVTAMADNTAPVQINARQMTGALFSDVKPVVTEHDSEKGKYTTRDVEFFLSRDKQFDAGMYESGPARHIINEPYGVEEYMYFLEGGVTLTDATGKVLEISAGDSLVIPSGFTGVWDTEGYRKIYVIYNPDGPVE